MDDLSTLCTICHIEEPIYTCPRCSMTTCSLACSKRHKIRSMCNGIRDPTVYRPISEVATPWGIDHDYNFIHGIETRMERADKILIEDLELVSKRQMEAARAGETEEQYARRTGRRLKELPGEVQVAKMLKQENIKLIKAPKGMRRNKENATSWNKKLRHINWQVEWIREGAPRALYRALGSKPLGDFYDAMCEEERYLSMTEEERKREKRVGQKRKAEDKRERERLAKKARIEEKQDLCDLTTPSLLQDPNTGAWNLTPSNSALDNETELQTSSPSRPNPKFPDYKFYLHRPLTPASFPKVLAPICPTKPLTELLRQRYILEFPTIHVLPNTTEGLPKGFMLESDYLKAVGNKPRGNTDTEMGGTNESDSDESSSSEESDSDESVEEGEVV
ncbi:uncharacterized protein L3040_001557 [Drepanopeziza brunnea f. sp. 'multigermtubi']|uniref:Box C/D snoRNA protein 1 n=1 Tax=Marssonina brunnea f. sp. multigermtubi (strain MB_m1) TaxID=1072389 RepID=K1XRH5_MARBU|nr:uncharacterized protein MBM_06405 [Drepanopeziza brunnea f. sp. 'multigermtubi' MB_m1]EKD15189.1 hypothetical protein MBM_06405 [Drepanopeziza brunnea f. sp. 'multigermtubi' MB_m1]KAJ5051786.1 hypothetical protein L3040_001557 [Drepanopeziza brunnea f. sp. 'multigermtubi']